MFFGVDPGLNGAIAAFDDDGRYHSHIRMPTVGKVGNPVVKKFIDGAALNGILNKVYAIEPESSVYLELPNVIPKNGPVRTASLFHSIGIAQGVLEGFGCKIFFVNPIVWKKAYNLRGKNKKESIQVAQHLCPGIGKLLIKDADVAEAALIGLYGDRYIKPTLNSDFGGEKYDLF